MNLLTQLYALYRLHAVFFRILSIIFISIYVDFLFTTSNQRLLLILLPHILLLFTLWIALSLVASPKAILRLMIFTSLITTAIPMNFSHPLPADTRGQVGSTQLWHISLQHPAQTIRRMMPRPIDDTGHVRLLIRLGLPYSGRTQLQVSIDGTNIGTTSNSLLDYNNISQGEDLFQLEKIFSSTIFRYPDKVEVAISQDGEENGPRIQIIRGHLGNTFGKESTSFGIDGNWFQGIPNPLTGLFNDATPVMWLETF